MSDEIKPSWLEIFEKMGMAASAEVGYSLMTGQPPNPVSLITTLGDSLAARRRSRGEKLLAPIVEDGSVEELVAKIHDDPEFESLVWNALQAAMATSLDNKRIYLARVVRNALNSDEPIDAEQEVVRVLGELDGPQIRALTRLRAADDENLASNATNDEIFQAALRKEASSVLAALARAGVVYQGSVETSEGLYSIPDPHTYSITAVNPFGRYLLTELESVELRD